jgi:F0F1-type ATP synthase membrane subunit b/b'
LQAALDRTVYAAVTHHNARAEASNEAAQISAEYGQRSAAIIEEAQRTVAAELETARTSQPQLVNDLANMMVERTITEKAS